MKTKTESTIKQKTLEHKVPDVPLPTIRNGGPPLENKIAVRCMVLHKPENGGVKIEQVYDPPASRIFSYRKKVTMLLIERNGKLEAYNPFGSEIGLHASKLAQCKLCLPAQGLLRCMSGKMEKLALGALVAAIGIGAILLIAIMDAVSNQ